MTKKEKRTVPISFRLTEKEFEPFKKIIDTTSLGKTDLFRAVFLDNQYSFNVQERRPVDYDRLIFLFNKSSNNINQIAHRLNSAYRNEVISEKVYLETLNQLISIELLLKGALEKC